MSAAAKNADIESKAEVVMYMEWPEGDVDIDIWIKTPSGSVMSYNNMSAGLVTLERDDTGNKRDMFIVNGKNIINKVLPDIQIRKQSINIWTKNERTQTENDKRN